VSVLAASMYSQPEKGGRRRLAFGAASAMRVRRRTAGGRACAGARARAHANNWRRRLAGVRVPGRELEARSISSILALCPVVGGVSIYLKMQHLSGDYIHARTHARTWSESVMDRCIQASCIDPSCRQGAHANRRPGRLRASWIWQKKVPWLRIMLPRLSISDA
jgi:hypothetical protein